MSIAKGFQPLKLQRLKPAINSNGMAELKLGPPKDEDAQMMRACEGAVA
jgi:hypothetical protein